MTIPTRSSWTLCRFLGLLLLALAFSEPLGAQQRVVEYQPVGRVDLGRSSAGLDLAGDYAYSLSGPEGLEIIDIRNPEAPILVGRYPLPAWSSTRGTSGRGIQIANQHAFIVNLSSPGLRVVSLADPIRPEQVAHFRERDFRAEDVMVTNGLAVLSRETSLQILDVSQPKLPKWRSEIQGRAIGWVGEVLLVRTRESPPRLELYSLADSAQPRRLARIEANAPVQSAGPSPVLTYVPWFGSVQVFDLADSATPRKVFSEVSEFRGPELLVGGLLIRSWQGLPGAKTWDVTSLAQPVNLGYRDWEFFGDSTLSVSAICGRDGLLFVTAGDAGFGGVRGGVLQVLRPRVGLTQRVTFLNPFESYSERVFFNSPMQLRARSSSGRPVTFRVAGGPGEVTGDRLRLTGAGDVLVVAEQLGDDQWFTVAVTNRINVKPNTTLNWLTPATPVVALDSPRLEQAKSSEGIAATLRVGFGPARIDEGRLVVTNVGAVQLIAELNTAEWAAAPLTRWFNPVEVTFQPLGGHTNGPAAAAMAVTAAGTTAFVAEGTNGVRLVRLTEPDRPQSFGRLPTAGAAGSVAVDGSTAYVTTGVAGVEIFAWSGAGAAERLATVDTPGNASAVRLDGSRLYVADGGAGWSVYDVADPRKPQRLAGVDTSGLAQDLQVVGQRLFVADGNRGLSVYSVTDPTAPELVGHFDVTSTDVDGLPAEGQAMRVHVVGTTAFLLDWPVGVRILDLSDPAHPHERGRISSPRRINGMSVSGTQVVLAVGADGIEKWDVSDPAAPMKTGMFDTAGSARAVVSWGERWLVADREDGLQVLADEPAGLRFVGGCGAAEFARRIQVEGDLAYVANGLAGLKIFDVSNPALPRPVGELDTPGNTLSLHVVGDRAYLADELGGMRIVDVSAPSRPVALGSYRTTAPIRSVEVRAGVAWVAADVAGVETLDIRDPANVIRLGKFLTLGSAGDVAVSDDFAYVADSQAGVNRLPAGDPSNLVSTALFSGASDQVEVRGTLAVSYNSGNPNGSPRAFDAKTMKRISSAINVSWFVRTLQLRDDAVFAGGADFVVAEYGTNGYPGGAPQIFSFGASNKVHGVSVQHTNAFVTLGEQGLRVVGFNRAIQRTIQKISSPTNLVYSADLLSLPAQASSGLPLAMEVLSGPGSVEGGQLRLAGAGVLRLRLIQSGSELFKPVTNVVNVTVVPNQSIQLVSPTNTALEPGVAHPIVATASSGLPVTVRVLSGPGEIRGSALWVTNIGPVVWAVEQAGDGAFSPVGLTNRVNALTAGMERVWSTYTSGESRALKIVGQYAYLAGGGQGLAIVDLANPEQPVAVGSMAAGRQAADLDAQGTFLFVTGEAGDLVAFDISAPDRPRALGTLTLPGLPQSVRVLGNYLLVPAGPEGLLVIDASNPAQMRLAGQLKPGGFAEFVAIRGSCAYLAAGQGGLVVVDISNPEQPRELGRFQVTAQDYCWSVEVGGGMAYVGTAASGVFMVDVSNPANPKFSRQLETGPVRSVRLRDGFAYLLLGTSLAIYDVSGGSAPADRGGLALWEAPQSLELAGDYAYLAADTRMIVVRVAGRVGQQITHAVPASVSYSPVTIPLPAWSSSGLPVNWRLVRGPAQVMWDGLKVSGLGEVVLEASQAGASWLEPAIVRTSIFISPGVQTLVHDPLPELISRFRPTSFTVTSSSGLPLTVNVSGPATVTGNRVIVTGEGNISLWATQAGNGLYQYASLSKGFTVRYVPNEVGWSLAALDFRFSPGTNAAGAVMAFRDPGQTNLPAGSGAESSGPASANVRFLAGENSTWRAAYSAGDRTGWLMFSSPELQRQLQAGTNIMVTVRAELSSDPATAPGNPPVEVVLLSAAEVNRGKFQVLVGNETYEGTWTTSALTGVGTFDRGMRRMTVGLKSNAPDPLAGEWNVMAEFVPGPGSPALELPPFSAVPAGPQGMALRMSGAQLGWNPARHEFTGMVALSQGEMPSPAGLFLLTVVTPQDEDADGTPDLIDAVANPRLSWDRSYSSVSLAIYGAVGEMFRLEKSRDMKTWEEITWLRTAGFAAPIHHFGPAFEANQPQFWRLRGPE